MDDYKIKVVLLDEALTFVRSLPIKVQEKIVYNYKKIENGLISKELFKKLDGTEIWELRTLYNGNCYRLFSFGTLIHRHLSLQLMVLLRKVRKLLQRRL